ncbi:metallophosphoesterase [Serpentinicella alkaliphila]|uniref:Calcineurin-like phosphoesterase domain-containing protein n=1 Tax=Serpentinicella alkaliphila TaxID=1734049 RepID=A0A4V2T3Y9_9FIRM|nr:metallophosphoesterase [Serpentinicella alkaliphila]QUH26458.1 metallophosphoesterase [Serpentinicella alkaliphila]TCQ03264.1 hypothetical protein EDD79_101052 [Serpentinicella alkaliphila]
MLKKLFAFFIFLSVFSLVYGGMNYYVYRHIVEGFLISGLGLVILRIAFWFLGSAYIINQIIKRKYYVRLLAYSGAAWMGILSFALSVFIIFDIAKLFMPTAYYKLGFILTIIVIAILTLISVFNAAKGPVLKRIEINNNKLDGESFKVLLLSDVHLGMLTSSIWLEKIVSRINELDVDVIAITGDFIDDRFKAVKEFIPIVTKLKAKYGVFAVTGNHEHYQGENSFEMFCKEANIRILHNETESILDKVNLIGLGDSSVSRRKDFHKVIKELLNGVDKDLYNILLIHQPLGFEKSTELGIDLQLSGHTHGGQIPPLSIIVYLVYKYSYGLYSFNKSHIYTTSGTGTWGPPMRLFTKSEMVLLEIKNR